MKKITANTIHELIEKAKEYKGNTHYYFEKDGLFFICIYKEFYEYIIDNNIYEGVCLKSDVDSMVNQEEEIKEYKDTKIKENKEKEKEIEGITEDHIDIMMSGYNSKDAFGPEMRSVLEKIIINYDHTCPNQQRSLSWLIQCLPDLIPCEECAEHFAKQTEDLYLGGGMTRIQLLERLINAHDNVNEWNGKPRLGFKEGLKSISERIEKQLLDSELKNKPSN